MKESGNPDVTNVVDQTDKCPVTFFVRLVGGKWKPIILFHLSKGPRRFGELDVRIDGLSRKVLTDQLKELEQDGLVIRKAYKEIPPRVEYELTAFGLALLPVFESMSNWSHFYNEHYIQDADYKRNNLCTQYK